MWVDEGDSMQRHTRAALPLLTLALLAAACGSTAADRTAGEESAESAQATVAAAVETAPPVTVTDVPAPETTAPVALPVDEYFDAAAGFIDAPDDRSLPPESPTSPAGSYGFSRYVFQQADGEIVPTLVEGPRGYQVRCQQADQDCSYLELKALHDSGDEPPEYLGMTRDELGDLVGELAITEAAVDEHNTIEEACAAGFTISSSQNPNMGIHAQNPNGTGAEFDPARPSMILYAREGGERLTQAEQGDCVDGEWTGDPGYESVGAVFTLPMTEEHPSAFSGPIDNWHIHFNTCAGSPEEGGEPSPEGDDNVAVGSRTRCEESGGFFLDVIPVWMMHAYVDPGFDAQGGVFAMFNPSIWPVSDVDSLTGLRTQPVEGAAVSSINNFAFGNITVNVGDSVVFTNSDGVPHTVTGGNPGAPSGEFDSGVFGTGQSFETSFDTAGEYELFCVLHPGMTGVITVE